TIGLVLYPDLACHAEDLYERADYALYHGKRLRRGGVCLFSADHQRRIQHEAAIEQALRSADLEAQLSVVFQPIMCMASGQALAFEALARWHHPQDRKSTRLNSSHVKISYAACCLKKQKT